MVFFGLEKASLLETSSLNSAFHSNIEVLWTEKKQTNPIVVICYNVIPAAVFITPSDLW